MSIITFIFGKICYCPNCKKKNRLRREAGKCKYCGIMFGIRKIQCSICGHNVGTYLSDGIALCNFCKNTFSIDTGFLFSEFVAGIQKRK